MGSKPCFSWLCFVALSLWVSFPDPAWAQLTSSGSVLTSPGQKVTIWCNLGQDYESCRWTSPTGEVCLLLHNDYGAPSACMSSVKPTWSPTGKGNCSITITSVVQEDNGNWMCTLADLAEGSPKVGSVKLQVAKAAKVEFQDVYGTVISRVGVSETLTCQAKHGRPAGQFVWQVADQLGHNVTALTSRDPPNVVQDSQGFFTVTQSILYEPNLAHDGKSLFCIYNQTDAQGKPLFPGSDDRDEVSISIRFLDRPQTEPVLMQDARIGKDYQVTMVFGAKPMPEARDVVWLMKGTDLESIVITNTMEGQLDGRYLAYPMEAVGPNKYKAKLTIKSVQPEDLANEHHLQVAHRALDSNTIEETVLYRFKILAASGEGSGTSESLDETTQGLSTTSIVVIVVVVLLALLIFLAVGLVYYAKKNKVWCYSETGSAGANTTKPQKPPGDLEEANVPLNDEASNKDKPIIKKEFQRPE